MVSHKEALKVILSHKEAQQGVGQSHKEALEAAGQSHIVCRVLVFFLIFIITFSIVHLNVRWTFKIRTAHSRNTEEKLSISQRKLSISQRAAGKIVSSQIDIDTPTEKGVLFFLHMHKAGGSTVNLLFNNFKKWPQNINGNPWAKEKNGFKIIRFYNYGKEKFDNFLQELFRMKVEFVAFEWNYFKHIDEIDISRIRLLTCIRDPYTRFVSTMFSNHAIKREKLNPVSWMKRNLKFGKSQQFWVNYNKPNFYVKIMNGFGNEPPREVSRGDLKTAKRNLDDFDVVMILEIAESFRLLRKYGVEYKGESENVNDGEKYIGMTREQFKKLNELDYEFYEYAKNISSRMLNDLK